MSAAVYPRRQHGQMHSNGVLSNHASTSTSSLANRHAVPQATSRVTVPYKSSATRSTNQPGPSNYKVELERTGRDGQPREVIVIQDSPDNITPQRDDGAAPASKRRKPNQSDQSANAYDPGYAQPKAQPNGVLDHTTSSRIPERKVAASGVGSKRKNDGTQKSSSSRKKEVHVQQSCDDKDGHFIVREREELCDGRFRIERLLGQGTFGKVVEAFDNELQQYCAVKIIRSIQKYRDASKVEIKVLQALREADPENRNNCIHMIDYFDDRQHICIVTELLSTSVFDFLKDNDYAAFPNSHIQSFARQLLGSVAFLHDLGLVHTDLKPENILLVDNKFKLVTTKSRTQTKTKRVLHNTDIRLIDFGSATFEDEYHASVVSTRHYRGPEIILGLGWSYPCDVWSIGCILVEFYTGEALFQTHDNLEHLAMMDVVFGRMPDRWARVAARSKPEFFKGNRLDFPQSDTSRQSRKYVKAMKPLADVIPPGTIINSRFLDLLQKLLAWDPAQRISVHEALRHPFFSLAIDDEGAAA